MSRRREQELLAQLVELIKKGKINDASAMLEADKEKKLAKYCDERGWTALHFACQLKQYESALLVIQYGGDATLPERFARTPLDLVNDPNVKKELKEAHDGYVAREKATELALEEEQRIAAIQAKIRAKMEEEIRQASLARDAKQKKMELEMAKKAEEAMKITSVEKLLYTLEEKEKTIARMRIEFERDLFELQKQLHAAKQDISNLTGEKAELQATTAAQKEEIESLKAEIVVLKASGATLTEVVDSKPATPATHENHTGTGKAPMNTSKSLLPSLTKPVSTGKPGRFTLGGLFGGK